MAHTGQTPSLGACERSTLGNCCCLKLDEKLTRKQKRLESAQSAINLEKCGGMLQSGQPQHKISIFLLLILGIY